MTTDCISKHMSKHFVSLFDKLKDMKNFKFKFFMGAHPVKGWMRLIKGNNNSLNQIQSFLMILKMKRKWIFPSCLQITIRPILHQRKTQRIPFWGFKTTFLLLKTKKSKVILFRINAMERKKYLKTPMLFHYLLWNLPIQIWSN